MEDCLFCKIASGAIPAKKVFEDEEALAFYDIEPQAPTHVLVIPKKHIASLFEMTAEDAPLMGRLLERAEKVAVSLGLGERGARFVINCKEDAQQSVPHIHIHILGGRKLGWPPG